MTTAAAHALGEQGRVWFRNSLSAADLMSLERLCDLDNAPGARIPLKQDVLAAVAPVTAIVRRVLDGAKPVRLIAFNKNAAGNWMLPWHQDRVIAVSEKADVPGYVNWTRKAGDWHVEPPVEVLNQMLFARVHLDATTTANGCLELALRSHAQGKILEADIPTVAAKHDHEFCESARGDLLLAKALILHRSGASTSSSSRRALRIDYCALDLPHPLQWALAG